MGHLENKVSRHVSGSSQQRLIEAEFQHTPQINGPSSDLQHLVLSMANHEQLRLSGNAAYARLLEENKELHLQLNTSM